MKKRKNSLIPEDHISKNHLDVLKEEGKAALENLTVEERINFLRQNKIDINNIHLERATRLFSEESERLHKKSYPNPVGKLDMDRIIVGEVHESAQNWDIYPKLLEGLKARGFNTLSIELPPNVEAQQRLNDAFLIAKDSKLSAQEIELKTMEAGTTIPLVYAMKLGMNVAFVDSNSRNLSGWKLNSIPKIAFDPNDPNTILDDQLVTDHVKTRSEELAKRNISMAKNIENISGKVVHIGGRDHNKGLQYLLNEKNGETPLSIILDYPDFRARDSLLEGPHAYLCEYPNDIISLVDKLSANELGKKASIVSNLQSPEDQYQEVEASEGRIKAFLLSGLVGTLMSRAASLGKHAPQQQNRIFTSLIAALSQITPLDIKLDKVKEALSRKKEEQEKVEKKDKEKKRKDEEEKKRRLEEMQKQLEKSEDVGFDMFYIFNIFKSLMLSQNIEAIAPSSPFPNTDITSISDVDAEWLITQSKLTSDKGTKNREVEQELTKESEPSLSIA